MAIFKKAIYMQSKLVLMIFLKMFIGQQRLTAYSLTASEKKR